MADGPAHARPAAVDKRGRRFGIAGSHAENSGRRCRRGGGAGRRNAIGAGRPELVPLSASPQGRCDALSGPHSANHTIQRVCVRPDDRRLRLWSLSRPAPARSRSSRGRFHRRTQQHGSSIKRRLWRTARLQLRSCRQHRPRQDFLLFPPGGKARVKVRAGRTETRPTTYNFQHSLSNCNIIQGPTPFA